MNTARLETFSDAILAIIITITVLGIRVPTDVSVTSLIALIPVLFTYAWSFQTVGTYWNNHHHLMHSTKEVNGKIMWTNLHLLFWLSLIPFATEWLGAHIGMSLPTALYCTILFAASLAYTMLEYAIVERRGNNPLLAAFLGRSYKNKVSLIFGILSIAFAFIFPWISYVFVVFISLIWFIPERRVVEKLV